MSDITQLVKDFIINIESVLNSGLDNIYINTTLKVFLVLYAAFAAPKLPSSLVWLFDNIIFRIIMAFIIVFMATRDPSLAILIAIGFIITLQVANKYRLINTSLSVADKGEYSWLPSAKQSVQELPMENQEQRPHVDTVKPINDMNPSISQSDIDMMNMSMPSETLKQPILEPSPNNPNEVDTFTSKVSDVDEPTNLVPGADQQSCYQTFSNQHCIQGIQSEGVVGLERGSYFATY